jgi:hypothetical protein
MKAPTSRVARGSDEGLQGLFLHSTQKAYIAADVKTDQAIDAALLTQLVQLRIVSSSPRDLVPLVFAPFPLAKSASSSRFRAPTTRGNIRGLREMNRVVQDHPRR